MQVSEEQILDLLQTMVRTAFNEGRAGVPWADSKARQATRRLEHMKNAGQGTTEDSQRPADTDGGPQRADRRNRRIRKSNEQRHSNRSSRPNNGKQRHNT